MSKSKKRRRKEAPMPLSSAGLIRFFEEESRGIKIGPVAVVLLAIILILSVGVAWAVFG